MPTTAADEIERAARFGADNYRPLEVVLARGKGAYVWDVDGRRYVDMLGCYSALSAGHCHPRIVAALVEQAERLTLTSRAFHNDRLGAMLERVARVSGFARVLPMNTGTEAVETAIKAARRWGYERKGIPDGRAEIIVASGNFHGRSTTIVGFSDEVEHARGFGPPTPGFVLVPWNDAGALERAIGPHTAAVLIEPIQGEAGVRIPSAGYLARVRDVCTRRGVLLCFDEVQTGLGRTGRMFAWQHEQARPDLMILGKALGGGVYPVSCLCADDDVMSVFTPGSHGSTFGGNPLAAAVAIAALDVIEQERLCERSAALGLHALERLRAELRSSAIAEIRGRGLMLAIEYREPIGARIARELAAVGVLAKDTRRTTIRLLPPLIIEQSVLDDALSVAIPVLQAGGSSR